MSPGAQDTFRSEEAIHQSLIRYRIMAYTTAVLLIVLVFGGVPLQFAAGRPQLAKVVGTLHGFLYIVYLFTAFDLARRIRLRFVSMVLVLLAGTIPFCAIIAERLLTRMIEGRHGSGAVDHRGARSTG